MVTFTQREPSHQIRTKKARSVYGFLAGLYSVGVLVSPHDTKP